MAMVFINKAVLMQYAHSMTLLTLQVLSLNEKRVFSFRSYNGDRLLHWYDMVLFICCFDFSQQLATSLLIHIGRTTGYTKARGLDMATARKLLPVSIFYNANVAFALASLKGVNIPMYIAIKRLTPLAVLIAGIFSGKGKPTTQVCNPNCFNGAHASINLASFFKCKYSRMTSHDMRNVTSVLKHAIKRGN